MIHEEHCDRWYDRNSLDLKKKENQENESPQLINWTIMVKFMQYRFLTTLLTPKPLNSPRITLLFSSKLNGLFQKKNRNPLLRESMENVTFNPYVLSDVN